MLSICVNANQKEKVDHLSYVMAAYQTNQHKGSWATPNLLILNRELIQTFLVPTYFFQ